MPDPKKPQRGDTVFVPDLDGTWLGGIVNGYTTDGRMLVGVRGHKSGATLVLATTYLTDWCYPGDVGKKSLAAERLDPRATEHQQ